MGIRAELKTEVNVNAVKRLARLFHLPEPVRYDDCDYIYYMTAKMIRVWYKKLMDMEIELHSRVNPMLTYNEHEFISIGSLISGHAQDYIGHVSYRCELEGKDRKTYLRNKTKEYRLIFDKVV